MCRQNKVCIATHFPPAWGGGGEALEFGGSPYPQRSVPRVVRAPRASMINCSNPHRVTEQHNHRPRHRMATRTATAAPLSEQRGFQDFHPCFGGPHNPVTGPGETSEASLPPFSYTVHGCHRLPGYRHIGSTHAGFPLRTKCRAAPRAYNVRSVGGRFDGHLCTVWDRPIVLPHHHHTFRPIADLRFRPARAPRNRVAEFSPNARPRRDRR